MLKTVALFKVVSQFTLSKILKWQVMCTDYVQEKTELINALIKDKKLSDLPKITQVKF